MDDHETHNTDNREKTQNEQEFDQGISGILDPNSPDNVFGPFFLHGPDFGPLLGPVLTLGSLAGELVLEVGLALAHLVSRLFDQGTFPCVFI